MFHYHLLFLLFFLCSLFLLLFLYFLYIHYLIIRSICITDRLFSLVQLKEFMLDFSWNQEFFDEIFLFNLDCEFVIHWMETPILLVFQISIDQYISNLLLDIVKKSEGIDTSFNYIQDLFQIFFISHSNVSWTASYFLPMWSLFLDNWVMLSEDVIKWFFVFIEKIFDVIRFLEFCERFHIFDCESCLMLMENIFNLLTF